MSSCDSDLKIHPDTLEEVKRVANEQTADSLVIADDLEAVAGASEVTDAFLTSVAGTLTCGLRIGISLLATLTATPEELRNKYPNLERQFTTVLSVERLGDYWTLTVISSKTAPDQFEIDSEVIYPEIAVDALGNSVRLPFAKPFPIPAHNTRF